MFDNQEGTLKNKAPMKTDQRVVLLSPSNESYAGPQYASNPVSAGGIPPDPLGYNVGGETPDSEFRSWPESGPKDSKRFSKKQK